jgi:hypothetical protein
MPRIALPKHLKEAAQTYAALHEAGRTATNLANKGKTVFRNIIKDYWQKEGLPIGSYIRTGGTEYRYESNETTSLDAAAIVQMYENEEITKEQFIRMFNVDKGEASKILGGDVIASITITSIGDKLDVRTEDLPIEDAKDECVVINEDVRKKINRSMFGNKNRINIASRKQEAMEAAPAKPAKKLRRIIVRGNK